MTLPPWLWRILRSRKVQRTTAASISLLAVTAAAFYPVANWLGDRACKKVAAELEGRGYLVPLREVPIHRLEDSFYGHEVFLQEATLPDADRLFGYDPPLFPRSRPQPAWTERIAEGSMTRDEAQLALKSLAGVEARRSSLVAAIRQSAPLDQVAGNHWLVMPERERQAAYDMASFLGEHALLSERCGNRETALEEFEAALQVMGELRDPRLIPRHYLYSPYDLMADKIGRWGRTLMLREEPVGWSEEQLARLDAALAKFDFLQERAALLDLLPGSYVCTVREIEAGKLPGPPGVDPWLASWTWEPRTVFTKLENAWPYLKPRGLYELDRAAALREFTTAVEQAKAGLPELEVEPLSVPARRFYEASGAFGKSRELEERLVGLQSSKAEILQLPLSMARHAIALERQRLRHGEYPEALDALDRDLREALPPDPASGKPPIYVLLKGDKISYRLSFASASGGKANHWQAPWR